MIHDFDLLDVVLVEEDGGASDLFEAVGSGDVIDVGVGDEDLFDGELVPGKEEKDAGDVVAGVDKDRFAGVLIAEDGAVALKRTYRDGFKDHNWLRVMVNPNCLAAISPMPLI